MSPLAPQRPDPELRRMLDELNRGFRAAERGLTPEQFAAEEAARLDGAGSAASVDDTSGIAKADGWDWAIVEIFGHRRHAGRTREEERFGAKMLRIDIPNKGDPETHGWTTHFYGGSAIFSFSLTDEASALQFNRPYAAPALVHRRSVDDFVGTGSSGGDDD